LLVAHFFDLSRKEKEYEMCSLSIQPASRERRERRELPSELVRLNPTK